MNKKANINKIKTFWVGTTVDIASISQKMSKLYLKHSILTRSNTIITHKSFCMFFANVFFTFTAFLTNFSIFTSCGKWQRLFWDLFSLQIFWQVIWILRALMAFAVGKFNPFAHCALNCMFGLINSSPNTQRNFKRAREEPFLSATGGSIWYKT